MRGQFYEGSRKVIPNNFLEEFISPLALSVWIMDDGTNELGYSKCLRINTQSFTKEEQEYLCKILKEKYGFFTTLNQDKGRHRLRFAKRSMKKLTGLIQPYILPSMYYKLSP